MESSSLALSTSTCFSRAFRKTYSSNSRVNSECQIALETLLTIEDLSILMRYVSMVVKAGHTTKVTTSTLDLINNKNTIR